MMKEDAAGIESKKVHGSPAPDCLEPASDVSRTLPNRKFSKELDNSRIVGNIQLLAKRSGIQLGDVESQIGVSRGYLSRVANTSKSLSLSLVYDAADILGVSVGTLVDADFRYSDSDTEMEAKFIRKLLQETRNGSISWLSHGGKRRPFDSRYEELGLVSSGSCGAVYHTDHSQNADDVFVLSDDIAVYENFAENKNLVIIPYKTAHDDYGGFDYILVWQDSSSFHWEKMFFSCDDPSGQVATLTFELFDAIRQLEDAAKVTPEVRSMIANYLK